jgi:ribosomal protein L7/L12
MISSEFRAVAAVLSKHIPDVYTLLGVTDEVMSAIALAAAPDTKTHDGRVLVALNSPVIIDFLVETRKINAIKELRAVTLCGLKEAKDAVEDSRVVEAAAQVKQQRDLDDLRERLNSNPWDNDHDPDEPPF